MSMSSLALGRGLEDQDLELWLAGIFTAAELVAADLLLQLSGADAAGASISTTPSSSPRWVVEDLAVDEEGEEEERVVEETAVSTELDRRARKRCRLLSDLYAATSPVNSASVKKRKTCDDDDEGGESESSSSSSEARYRD